MDDHNNAIVVNITIENFDYVATSVSSMACEFDDIILSDMISHRNSNKKKDNIEATHDCNKIHNQLR